MDAPAVTTANRSAKTVLIVSGVSGAGKSTTLRTLEDLGWEVVDNLPLGLLGRFIEAPSDPGFHPDDRPLALGIDTRTRGFDAQAIVRRIKSMRELLGQPIDTLYLDCSGSELERRFAETRRRHPLALDRPAADGIARDRELTEPLRRWSNQVIDTTSMNTNELQQLIRERFSRPDQAATTVTVLSFGYSRGMPRNADLVFDMRYLNNPHWDRDLRPKTGLDADVGAYIAQDPAYAQSMQQLEDLLLTLVPRYQVQGKAYVTIAFGCTGGRHRSVHVAERVAQRLRQAGFSPTVHHRNLESAPSNELEATPGSGQGKSQGSNNL